MIICNRGWKTMKHYKQIIVNLLVEDDCNDEKIDRLAEEITEFVSVKSENDVPEIKEITTRVNL